MYLERIIAIIKKKEGYPQMKHPIRNMFIVLIGAVILIFSAGAFVLQQSGYSSLVEQEADRNLIKNNNICISFSQDSKNTENVFNTYFEKLQTGTRLIAAGLEDYVIDGKYVGETLHEEGTVVYFKDNEIVLPDRYPEDMPELLPKHFSEDIQKEYSDLINSAQLDFKLITTSEIKDNYYFVEWTDTYDFIDYLVLHKNNDLSFIELEKIYKGKLVIADAGTNEIMYFSDDLPLGKTLSELGLDLDVVSKGTTVIEDNSYLYSHLKTEDLSKDVFFLTPLDDINETARRWTFVFSIMILLLISTMVIWSSFVKKFVADFILNEKQKISYRPTRMIIIMAVYGLICSLIIFTVTFFAQGMSSLYNQYSFTNDAFDALENTMANRMEIQELRRNDEADWYTYYGKQIASLELVEPDITSQKALEKMSEVIDARYIIVFDENGNEISCSQDFIGYSLGKDKESPTYDFRRLLYGAESIVHEPEKDELLAEDSVLIGVRAQLPNKKYGAILICLDPNKLYETNFDSDINSCIDSIRYQNDLMIVVDRNDGKIIYSPEDKLLGRNISEFDIDITENKSLLNYYTIDNQRYYGLSRYYEDVVYYYFISNSSLSRSALSYSNDALSFFVAIYLICAFAIMFNYTDEVFEKYANEGIRQRNDISFEEEATAEQNTDEKKTVEKPAFIRMYEEMSPLKKTSILIELISFFFFLIFFFQIRRQMNVGDDSLIAFVLLGKWNRSFNLFAVAAIFILIITAILVILVLRFVTALFNLVLDTKGQTIINLIYSLIKYLAVIIVLYYSFSYLGFDTRGILASVGFITLAVSMGSRDLISDILAGITIVFEGEFQVGDMVKIDDFRGMVQEIGIRYTKLIGDGDDIKIIANRDIRSVTNMSKMNSWYTVELDLELDRPLAEIEKILKKELPKLGKKIPEVISGPKYKGISELGKDQVKVLLVCEYKEKDYYRVKRKLNREIYDLLEKENIRLI